MEVPHPDRPRSTSSSPASSRWRSDGKKPKLPGVHRRPRRHVQDDAEARGHGAVPAREGRPAHPRPWRHRAQGGELHRLHAVRAVSAPTGASTSRATRRSARRAVKAAATARSACSTASTSTTRSACTAASASRCARSTRCSGAPSTSTPSRNIAKLLHDKEKLGEWMDTVPEPEPLEIGAEVKGEEVACGRAERRLLDPRGRDGARRDRRRALAERRARRALPRGRARRRAPRSSSCSAPEFVAWVQVLIYIGAIVDPVPLRDHAHPRADAQHRGALDNDQRWPAAVVSLFLFGVLAALLVDAYGDKEIKLDDALVADRAAPSTVGTEHLPRATSSRSRSCRCCSSPRSIGAVVIARRD